MATTLALPLAAAPEAAVNPLARELGVTTGSFVRRLVATAQPGKLRLLHLPRLMRDELDMRVIDLMTGCKNGCGNGHERGGRNILPRRLAGRIYPCHAAGP